MAGRIFVTGDCHGDFARFKWERFPVQDELDREDYMIICGDFGGVWTPGEESAAEKNALDALNEKSFTTLFVDGNHENFDRLYEYPEEDWHGGRIHRIRDHIFHLCRGYIFEICGNRIFCFGGASSRDRRGVILDAEDPKFEAKLLRARSDGKAFRIKHLSWWEEELPNAEEYARARRNLKMDDPDTVASCGTDTTKAGTGDDGDSGTAEPSFDTGRAMTGQAVDYIITHCCATSAIDDFGMRGRFGTDEFTDFLDGLREKCTYKRWYFGHYHMDRDISKRETMLCDAIIPLGCTAEDATDFEWNAIYKRSDKVEFLASPRGERIKLTGHIYTVNFASPAGGSGTNEATERGDGSAERTYPVSSGTIEALERADAHDGRTYPASYDIFAEYEGEVVLIKNVPGKNITGRIK